MSKGFTFEPNYVGKMYNALELEKMMGKFILEETGHNVKVDLSYDDEGYALYTTIITVDSILDDLYMKYGYHVDNEGELSFQVLTKLFSVTYISIEALPPHEHYLKEGFAVFLEVPIESWKKSIAEKETITN